MAACRRHSGMLASHDLFCLDGMAIDISAGVVVGTNRGAFQGDSCKHATRTRVAKDLGAHPSIRIRGRVTPLGSTGNGSIGTQLNLAAENGVHAAAIHDQQDQVGRFSANLETDTTTFESVHCWRSPRTTEVLPGATNHGSAAVVCADSKSEFLDGRNYDYALSFF